jgi:hypothetical protein
VTRRLRTRRLAIHPISRRDGLGLVRLASSLTSSDDHPDLERPVRLGATGSRAGLVCRTERAADLWRVLHGDLPASAAVCRLGHELLCFIPVALAAVFVTTTVAIHDLVLLAVPLSRSLPAQQPRHPQWWCSFSWRCWKQQQQWTQRRRGRA